MLTCSYATPHTYTQLSAIHPIALYDFMIPLSIKANIPRYATAHKSHVEKRNHKTSQNGEHDMETESVFDSESVDAKGNAAIADKLIQLQWDSGCRREQQVIPYV